MEIYSGYKQVETGSYSQNETIAQQTKLNHVLELIDGFETPFGLELLSTVDFVKTKCLSSPISP